jgi:ketosteroid isomerase-like protein
LPGSGKPTSSSNDYSADIAVTLISLCDLALNRTRRVGWLERGALRVARVAAPIARSVKQGIDSFAAPRMFERYNEKARRAIFFARYEASNYGSRYIETEHLLLGLLREYPLPQPEARPEQIREEIERHITSGERYSTSVEVPLSGESKKALTLAAEESERLGHRVIGPEHLLLGILGVDQSLAAGILKAKNVKASDIRERISKRPDYAGSQARKPGGAMTTLDSFLSRLRLNDHQKLVSFFAQNALFVDASGKRWSREEISKGFAALFAPYAKKTTTYIIADTLVDTGDLLVATVLWKNAVHASEQGNWIHRMSVVLIPEGDDWAILMAQVTPVQLS